VTKKVKILASSLVAILFISVVTLFIPASSSYAYQRGILIDTPRLIISSSANGEASAYSDYITDGDESTFDSIPSGRYVRNNTLGPNGAPGTQIIGSYRLKSDRPVISILFYNQSDKLIYTQTNIDTTGNLTYLTTPVDAMKFSIQTATGNITKIYEFDIFHDASIPTATPSETPEPTVTPEPTATPEPSPSATPEIPSSDRAIVTVTLTTGDDKEFDLPMSEVNAFIAWYDSATGSARYGIDKHDNNKGPFSKRTEYVIHDKILTFEVSEYTSVE
jgi:hypothetical protein